MTEKQKQVQDETRADEPAPPRKGAVRGPGAFSHFVWRHRVAWLLGLCLLCIVADQASKVWAQATLAEPREVVVRVPKYGQLVEVREVRHVAKEEIVVIPKAFNFRYAENRAAAFSLTSSLPEWLRRPFLLIFSTLATLFFVIWCLKLKQPDGLLMTSFGLIIGGALGNFIDRVRLGYVIDFIDWYAGFINPSWPHWPTFNIADSCIVMGAGLVVYRTFRPLSPPDDEGAGVAEKASA